MIRKVSTLAHESGNDSVETGVLVAQIHVRELTSTFFACAEAAEILRCLGDNLTEEFEFNALGLRFSADLYHEEHLGITRLSRVLRQRHTVLILGCAATEREPRKNEV